MTIRIVTDSACDVPTDIAEKMGIIIIPVYINIGDQSYLDGVDLSRREFFVNLPTYDLFPTTAAPASGTFTSVYQQLANEGAAEILSLHIAANLSNTYNAARLGAEDVQGASVTLWDTKQITMGSGLQVIVAAEAAAAGCSMAEILTLLQEKTDQDAYLRYVGHPRIPAAQWSSKLDTIWSGHLVADQTGAGGL